MNDIKWAALTDRKHFPIPLHWSWRTWTLRDGVRDFVCCDLKPVVVEKVFPSFCEWTDVWTIRILSAGRMLRISNPEVQHTFSHLWLITICLPKSRWRDIRFWSILEYNVNMLRFTARTTEQTQSHLGKRQLACLDFKDGFTGDEITYPYPLILKGSEKVFPVKITAQSFPKKSDIKGF